METKTEKEFMEQFPSLKEMEDFIRHCEAMIKGSRENIDIRAQHYYDCIDDYSSGGMCDKAAEENISEHQEMIRRMKEQIETGNYKTETFEQDVLCHSGGMIVSESCPNLRFGACWIIKDAENNVRFVKAYKKQGKYEELGLKVMTRRYTVRYYYLPRAVSFRQHSVSEILNVEMVEPEMVAYPRHRKHPLVFFAINHTRQ